MLCKRTTWLPFWPKRSCLLVRTPSITDHTLKNYVESNGLYECRFFLLNQVKPLSAGKGILQRFLFSEFSACEATPERLCMLTTIVDPNQFDGCFFLIGHRNGLYTIFKELVENWLRISQRGLENRPAHKRFQDFKRIVNCLVKDLNMPVNIQGGFHWLSEYYPNNYSWIGLHGLALGWPLQSFWNTFQN